jgi:sialate O-acetylesterase
LDLNKRNGFVFSGIVLLFVAGMVSFPGPLLAEIRLPAVISSHMVIQQHRPIVLWGWADAGETVSVRFRGQTASSQADGMGNWRVELPPMDADARSSAMTFGGSRSPSVTLVDVLVGEVWLCSGQSNMEWPVERTHSPSPEIWRARYPQIRFFKVPRRTAFEPQPDVEAEWTACTPDTVRGFSAVGYYFGLELFNTLDVPIGLINASWGGTRIEPWTPIPGFQAVSGMEAEIEEVRRSHADYRDLLRDALPEWESWIKDTEQSLRDGGIPPPAPERPRHSLDFPQEPTSLYNGMIHPLVPFAVQGAIWYQGEANRNDGALYKLKMEALIRGWRTVWGQEDLAFLYVQLAPFNYGYNREETGGVVPDFIRLPLIWEAQRETLALPGTGMAVVTDITNLNDIHPRNKKEVGRRLSLWALARTYGVEDLVYSGPLYQRMETDGSRIRVFFDHVGAGLTALDGRPLSWFEIAGSDKVFYKAAAEIQGDTVVVWSSKVTSPRAVRLGWHQLAVPNLGNLDGLPASPFRSDRW